MSQNCTFLSFVLPSSLFTEELSRTRAEQRARPRGGWLRVAVSPTLGGNRGPCPSAARGLACVMGTLSPQEEHRVCEDKNAAFSFLALTVLRTPGHFISA